MDIKDKSLKDDNNIKKRIKKIISEQLGIKEDEVKSNSSFINDLSADSLDIIEFIMALEEEFNIQIPDEETEKIKTVQLAVDYIKKIALNN